MNDVLIMQLKREVNELMKKTEASLLRHDGKIAELCKYLKDNLSNSLSLLLDSMMQSGELDKIITDTIVNDIALINIRNESFVNVKEFGIIGDGITDETTKLEEIILKGVDIVIPEGCHIVVSRALNVHSSIKGYPNSSIKQITKRANIFNSL